MGTGASTRAVTPASQSLHGIIPNHQQRQRNDSSGPGGTFAFQLRAFLLHRKKTFSESESLLTDPEYDYMQNFSVVESDIERLERTMRTILTTPALCDSFKRYLAHQFCEQKLMFWLDVQALRKYGQKKNAERDLHRRRRQAPPGPAASLLRKARAPTLFGRSRELIVKAQYIYTRYINDNAEKRVELDGATIEEIEDTLMVRMPEGKVTETRDQPLREAYREAQQKIFHSLLFDHLAGFLASQFFSQAQTTMTDTQAVTEANAVAEAVESKKMPMNLSDTMVTNPFCSYFLHQFLESLPPPSKADKKNGVRSVPAVELLECLYEINDFQSSTDPAHRQRRAHTIIKRYGTEELGCAPLREMQNDLMCKPRKFHSPDVSLFDTVYMLLANMLMADYLHDFLKSKFYQNMERLMVSMQQSYHQTAYKQICERIELVGDQQFGVTPLAYSQSRSQSHSYRDEEKEIPLKGASVLPPVKVPGKNISFERSYGDLSYASSSEEFDSSALKSGQSAGFGIVQQVSMSPTMDSEDPRNRLSSLASGKSLSTDISHSATSSTTHSKDHSNWKNLLEDPLGVSLFKKFSIRNLQDENIRFWIQVKHFKSENYINPPEGNEIIHDENQNLLELRKLRAQNIVDVFIREGSELQVNVSALCRNKVLQKVVGENIELDTFDEAHKEVEYLMKANLWSKFKATPMYRAYKQKEMKNIERLHLKHLAERNQKRKMQARSPDCSLIQRKFTFKTTDL